MSVTSHFLLVVEPPVFWADWGGVIGGVGTLVRNAGGCFWFVRCSLNGDGWPRFGDGGGDGPPGYDEYRLVLSRSVGAVSAGIGRGIETIQCGLLGGSGKQPSSDTGSSWGPTFSETERATAPVRTIGCGYGGGVTLLLPRGGRGFEICVWDGVTVCDTTRRIPPTAGGGFDHIVGFETS
jgi:hypothetical protein